VKVVCPYGGRQCLEFLEERELDPATGWCVPCMVEHTTGKFSFRCIAPDCGRWFTRLDESDGGLYCSPCKYRRSKEKRDHHAA
jgi:hypothetical protein